MQQFRGGLVFEAHRLLYFSTLGLRVIKNKKKFRGMCAIVPMRFFSCGALKFQGSGVSIEESILPLSARSSDYRGTSLIKNCPPPGHYSTTSSITGHVLKCAGHSFGGVSFSSTPLSTWPVLRTRTGCADHETVAGVLTFGGPVDFWRGCCFLSRGGDVWQALSSTLTDALDVTRNKALALASNVNLTTYHSQMSAWLRATFPQQGTCLVGVPRS